MKRLCLDCGAITTASRCSRCQKKLERAKNEKAGYRRTRQWQQLSLEARAAQPWCHCIELDCHGPSPCQSTDLVTDHIVNRTLAGGVRVLCRPCNSRKGNR